MNKNKIYNKLIKLLSYFIPLSNNRKNFRKKFLKNNICADVSSSIVNYGHNNIVKLILENGEEIINPAISGLKIIFYGNNNLVVLHSPIQFRASTFEMQSDSLINIQKSKYFLCNLNISPMNNNTLLIGRDFSCSSVNIRLHDEPKLTVKIGDDCMFSHDIEIRSSDGHTILNRKTKEILNPATDIKIGNHVWIGMRCILLKNTQIPDHSILGANSLINKSFSASHNRGGWLLQGYPPRLSRTILFGLGTVQI